MHPVFSAFAVACPFLKCVGCLRTSKNKHSTTFCRIGNGKKISCFGGGLFRLCYRHMNMLFAITGWTQIPCQPQNADVKVASSCETRNWPTLRSRPKKLLCWTKMVAKKVSTYVWKWYTIFALLSAICFLYSSKTRYILPILISPNRSRR